jgi:hypothetical protein
MSRTTKVSAAQARASVGATDWAKLKARSDAEIETAADSDPAAQRFPPQELREFKRAKSNLPPKVRKP